ncbi:MAG: DUF2490 domain-containing protein [Spartobacteria bacterium]|nr:DUF2490 domain-containing protein [Spartobacteria bacterium]
MKKGTLNKLMIAVAGMVLAGTASVYAYDDGDNQLWLKFETSGKITDKIGVAIEQEMKWGDGMGEFYDSETLMMASMPVTSWLNVGLGFREVFERKNKSVTAVVSDKNGTITYSPIATGDHYWRQEDRPTADFVFHTKLESGWKFDDRVRAEYRKKEGTDGYVRMRNRIRVKSPWKWTELAINPWAAWEANWEDEESLSGGDKWDRHRLYLGVGMKLVGKLKGGVYYCLQKDKSGDDWKDTNVLGLSIGGSF